MKNLGLTLVLPGTMRVEYSATKSVAEGKLDGSPLTVTGPITPPVLQEPENVRLPHS